MQTAIYTLQIPPRCFDIYRLQGKVSSTSQSTQLVMTVGLTSAVLQVSRVTEHMYW